MFNVMKLEFEFDVFYLKSGSGGVCVIILPKIHRTRLSFSKIDKKTFYHLEAIRDDTPIAPIYKKMNLNAH